MPKNRIEKLKFEIADLEDQRRPLYDRKRSADTQFAIAVVGLLVGLALVFTGLWWLGLLLVAAGALATITQGLKKYRTARRIADLDSEIAERRQEIIGRL